MKVLLIIVIGLLAFPIPKTLAQTEYHLVTGPPRHIRATLSDVWITPNAAPKAWDFFAASPPHYSGQSRVQARLSADKFTEASGQSTELSSLKRPVLWLHAAFPSNSSTHEITVTAVYDTLLYPRHLEPGAPAAPVPSLSDEDRVLSLRSSDTIDFNSPTFQQWLTAHSLRRLPAERNLHLAYRAFQTIRRLYHYNYEASQDRKVSSLCRTDWSDCGGLSFLLVAILRADGVPAHTLAGRLARSATKPEDFGQCHVRAEFYADGIGWIPVDISSGVSSADAQAINYFGNDPGDFLVMHTDTDLILDSKAGPSNCCVLQTISHWAWGPGSVKGSTDTTTWQVANLPL